MKKRVALVVAVARNGVIGAGGDLAWRIADDLKWFKKVTMGKPIVMGRKTYESIGKPLPGRVNIVITRNPEYAPEGVSTVRTVKAALDLANEEGAEEICVIGGGEIYKQTLPLADRIYLTRVDAEPEGDVFFPDLDEGLWRATRDSACAKSDRNEHACEFFILDRAPGKAPKALKFRGF